jgi:hypothetical protein
MRRKNAQVIALRLSPALPTHDLLQEVTRLLGPDYTGRRRPSYTVVHQALQELKDRLVKEQAHDPVKSE